MLLDPRWTDTSKVETADWIDWPAHDEFAIDSLISWLETKTGPYSYGEPKRCALQKYFQTWSQESALVGASFVALGIQVHNLPPGWDAIARASPFTFEAMLERARVLKQEQSA